MIQNKLQNTALEALDDDMRKEFWACLALRHAKNIGIRTSAKLVKHFGSAYDAVMKVKEWEAVGLELKAENISNNAWRTPARKEWEDAKDLEGEIIFWNSKYYPPLLKEIPDPPVCFYCIGNKELLLNPCISIVGSRYCSKLGADTSHYLGKALSLCGMTIVSGMARGIDRAAHYGGMKEIGSSIGVLGSGVDVIYPRANSDLYFDLKTKGLLISECRPGMPPDSSSFPVRNRIISALSYGTIVVEADIKSGSMITAKTASEQNRTVYTIPGSVGSQFSVGCQKLVRAGAKAIFNAEDVLEDLLPVLKIEVSELSKRLSDKKIGAQDLFSQISALESKVESQLKQKESLSKNKLHETEKELQGISSLLKDKKKELVLPEYEQDTLEYKIIHALKNGKLHLDELCQQLLVSPQEITVTLVQMEMQDHITRYEGAWFALYEQ